MHPLREGLRRLWKRRLWKRRLWKRGLFLVLDDVQPLLPQQRQVIQHPLQNLRVVTLPAVHLADDAKRMAGAVGLRGVAGESLVGHVRVVLEGTLGLHDIDASP